MQEEQDAELRYLQDNTAAFENQEAEQEDPAPQEVGLLALYTRILYSNSHIVLRLMSPISKDDVDPPRL